ncbi:amino acid permease/ SLC12A domain-containing protein [Aspergillus bertholletiae]|uniref:Amino acid permease/ SLC12A domain-containing protein n=1 Tax=Aspergillus bertholletiae TaxID=1226010 RepID=A0A5N7B1Z4_9EURO|nr:amino acid permease/ SLC12A domain-containing protein [Aspergillus bertholletiae]
MAIDEVTSAPPVTEAAAGNDNDKITTKTDINPLKIFGKKKDGSGNDDVEKDGIGGDTPPQELQRKLKSRHLQMIAIGGTIGTGLFISSGTAIAHSGPAGALIAYIFVGTIVFSVMSSLGEVATYLPISGSFTSYTARLVDPSLGCAMGWIYWFNWASTYAVELTATGLIIQYWDDKLSIAIFIAIFWVVITLLNFLPVGFYGEIEFWFSMIKVVTVLGFMIFAICIDAGVGKQGYLGFHTWKEPGAFAPYLIDASNPVSKFVGFWAVLIQAGFSYQGTELVGVAAGETENPEKTVPSAIRKTFIRILVFFVLTIFFMGLLVPYDNPNLITDSSNASASPMVIAAKLAGVKVLPSLINAVLLTVVLSAANSNVYSGSRVLLGLAQEKFAPPIFGWVTHRGVPYVSVAFTAAFGLLGFMNVSESGGKVFNWLVNISSVAGFICWTSISLSHLAFMRALKARDISRDTLPYKAMLQPYLTWYGLFFSTLIILTQGFTAWIPTFNVSDFFVAYICVIIFVVLYIGHKLFYRTKFVHPLEADLQTGRLQNYSWETARPKTWQERLRESI